MREHNNTPRLSTDDFASILKDTKVLGLACKPSHAKRSDEWFLDSKKSQISSTVPTQNCFSLSELEISQLSILQDRTQEDLALKSFCEEELKVAVELQRQRLVQDFENEMNKKMDEVESKICKQWEDKIMKMHVEYEQKIERHGEMLKEIQERKEENLQKQRAQLEQELTEKYNRDYMEKLESLNQNLQKIEENKFMDIIDEVKRELEEDCNEKHQLKLAAFENQIKEELESFKEEQDQKVVLETEYLANIEKDIQSAHEIEITDIMVRNQRDIEVLKEDVKLMEQEEYYEKIKIELKERLAEQYHVKEDQMNKEWKEKMETFKKEVNDSIAQQRTKRLSQEYLDIAVEKKGMESVVNDNSRVKKIEEANKQLQQRLTEQEIKYAQTVLDLKKELEELKPPCNYSERRSARDTSADRDSKRQKYQLDRPKSTDKLRKSCGDSTLGDMLMIMGDVKAPEDSTKKAETWRPRRNLSSSDLRKTSHNQSPDVKKNLSKTLMKTSLPPKQTSLSLTKPFNFERATKAILQMLSPSSPSELRYGQLDTRLESTQGPVIEANANNFLVREEGPCEVKEVKSENVPKVMSHQRKNSGMISERGRGRSSVEREAKPCEGTLRQKDVNMNGQRGSVTERRLDSEGEVPKNNEKGFTLKYKEFLHRQGSVTKKREGSLTQRKENFTTSYRKEPSTKDEDVTKRSMRNSVTNRKNVPENAYQKLFEIKTNDDEQAKVMKRLKKLYEENSKENELLENKCNSKEVDLCVSFPVKIGSHSAEQAKSLQNKLQTLFKLWRTAEVSHIARIAFMENLEKLLRYDDIITRLNLEINQTTQLVSDTEDIVKLLQWRTQLQGQISTDNFSYSLYEKVYMAIEDNNKDLKKALDCYQNKHGKRIQYRGTDLGEIIKLDAWECDYLRKVNHKSVQRLK